MQKSFFREIEQKWIQRWAEEKTYSFKDELLKPKYYILDMFPYPSGSGLHIGHVKGYLSTDIIARYKKMKGFCVLHPMGWDAFGLPAEQWANQNNSPPDLFTQANILNFKRELNSLFFSYDWELEINSSDKDYYAITQWIFSQFYEKGLARLEEREVNWVDELHTVLANEEIYEGKDGKYYSERGDYPVRKRELTQWVLKITKYAEELNSALEALQWPERLKAIQKAWIGAESLYWLEYEVIQKLFRNFLFRESVSGEYLFFQSNLIRWELSTNLIGLKNDLSRYWGGRPYFRYFKLQDWVFSRQRYWGEPIPIYYDRKKNIYLEKKLPLILPKYRKIDRNSAYFTPLEHYRDWMEERSGYFREGNTMPNWAASSWYYLAYLLRVKDGYLPLESKESIKRIERWMPVDLYIGGQEHATMHLLYSRFWYRVISELLGLSSLEPFKFIKNQGMILGSDGKKMSKSKHNYLSLSELLNEYGGDSIRLSVAFLGPLEQTSYWDNRQLYTFSSWIEKIYHYFWRNKDKISESKDKTIDYSFKALDFLKRAEQCIANFKFNVLISELMVFFKYLAQEECKSWVEHSLFLKLLSLLAPAISEECWRELLGENTSLYYSHLPFIERPKKTKINYSIQVNNKHKFTFEIPATLESEDEIFQVLTLSPEYINLIKTKKLKKYIVVKGKVINLIVSEF